MPKGEQQQLKERGLRREHLLSSGSFLKCSFCFLIIFCKSEPIRYSRRKQSSQRCERIFFLSFNSNYSSKHNYEHKFLQKSIPKSKCLLTIFGCPKMNIQSFKIEKPKKLFFCPKYHPF